MKHKQLWSVVVFMLLSVIFSASSILAEEEVPELTVEKVEVAAYDKVLIDKDDTEFDIIETLAIEDKIFLRVDIYISAKWTETAKKANIKSDEILLVSEDETAIKMAGYFKYGFLYESSTSFYAYRPHNWDKETPGPVNYNAVYIVPKDSKAFTFQLGSDISAKVEVPAVTPLPDPKDLMTVKLLGTKFSDEVPREIYVGGERRKTSVVPGHAKFLAVKTTVTPTAPNGPEQNSFYLNIPWFGLVYDDGYYAAAVGEIQSTGELSKTRSHTLKLKEGKWDTKEITVCFAVPGDTGNFTLIYLMSPVAEGNAGGAEKAEPEKPAEEAKPEEPAPLSGEELVKKVQSLLTALGYDPGPVDGKMGKKTADAIEAFQKEAGLTPDGEVTAELLDALKAKLQQ